MKKNKNKLNVWLKSSEIALNGLGCCFGVQLGNNSLMMSHTASLGNTGEQKLTANTVQHQGVETLKLSNISRITSSVLTSTSMSAVSVCPCSLNAEWTGIRVAPAAMSQ